jgi:hypothetical protein
LTEAPVLISLDYSKDFLIFSFSSFDTIVVVLLQNNVQGLEQPISFFSRELRDVEMKYEIMEKQAYALVKSLKAFSMYISHSRVIAYVPSASVKEIIIHHNLNGRRSKWIAKIIEFDLEINPTKLIKGKGLSRLLDESNCKYLGVNFIKTCLENQQRINPMLLPIMEKEVKKILDPKIIILLTYYEWVANLVPVRKKNGEIKLCVDFWNLNKISKKDNYPLPKMEHILQRVTGASGMSMIEGFSGYNHIFVLPKDRENTTFTTPWGTFMYAKMPFGLMNAGETF